MTLIKSISGIRGTIGGKAGDALTPVDIVRFSGAFVRFLRKSHPKTRIKIIVGRDARISGKMVSDLVTGTLTACGADVIDIGLTTTPTAEMAVTLSGSTGGVMITASHNPKQWNALKLLNDRGEFLSADDGAELLKLAETTSMTYPDINNIGSYTFDDSFLDTHINMISELLFVDPEAIRKAKFSVAVDAVNSTGGIAVPRLLQKLGVSTIHRLYCDPTGDFPHNPEPLPEHLNDICDLVVRKKADLGFVVDPDVDRLAIINEIGDPIGEEYTLVAVADYVLMHQPGNTVSNLSSTQALRDVTEKNGGKYFSSAVGEVNVVEMMKKVRAVIGGEGNGGVIYPDLHYGRDALAGIALFLTFLAKSGKRCSVLRDSYPNYFISKNKIELDHNIDLDAIMEKFALRYRDKDVLRIDGIKVFFGRDWVHLRRSNTEPIIRIYAESDMPEKAQNLARKVMQDFGEILNS